MRNVKFRAWDKEEKRMITDEQHFIPAIVTNKGVFKLNPKLREDNWILMPIERFELLECTGLKDKNGVDIYEGDILKFEHKQGYADSEQAVYMDKRGFYSTDEYTLFEIIERKYVYEVIGDIYENPELLESH